MQTAIALFVVTSVSIGITIFLNVSIHVLSLSLFIVGTLAILGGIVFAAIEVHRSYKVVLMEVMAEE
jgi:hypothetical protein